MLVCEVFYSLQGEGYFCGHPSIFIRTSGCNLRCRWCDTPFAAWNVKGDKKTPDEIIHELHNKFGFVNHIVLTGGEPLLQTDISELIGKLKERGHYITIETNGTVYIEDMPVDLYSISPKLSNSMPLNTKHIGIHQRNNDLTLLKEYVKCGIPYQMKFVVSDYSDIREIKNVVEDLEIPNKNVYLMPEGFTKDRQEKTAPVVAEICKKEKFVFCPRIHVYLWGDKRGV